jgi:Fuc2NAc and GlcNAc transferase
MFIILIVVVLASFCLTYYIQKIALQHNLIDTPNHRSAHQIPTPRGGGLAIAFSFFMGATGLFFLDGLPFNQFIGFLGSGFLVSLVGFLDDKYSTRPLTRLITHVIAAIWGLFWLGGFPPITVFNFTLENIFLLNLIVVLGLVWLTNLYNFMDGINGIASIQAISVGFGMTLIGYLSTKSIDFLPLVIASACCGFLYWNFPKAKIFMGDIGSGFLGLTLGLTAICQTLVDINLLYGFLILMAVFIVDSTWTLFGRFVRHQKIYQAHSSHAYQHATRKYLSHTKVSLAVLFINLFWLLPLAILVIVQYVAPISGLLMAYIPLLVLAIKLKAGIESAHI